MTQSSSTRKLASGLPSNPRAGTRPPPSSRKSPSVEQLPEARSHRNHGRTMRSQKSIGALPSSRVQEHPPSRRRSLSRPRHTPSSVPTSASSVSSASSSSSSFPSIFDRIRTQTGYDTSRTSFEEDIDHDEPDMKTQRSSRQDKGMPKLYQIVGIILTAPFSAPTEDGTSVWSHVVAAAGTLTISVSKTWAGSIATFSGEMTPPGQESRLTRSMKAYHLAKARNPSDLPAWLFESHERVNVKELDREDDNDRPKLAESLKSRGLRDMFNAAAASQAPQGPHRGKPLQTYDDRPSKASDRLQAMRDAKRGRVGKGIDKMDDRSVERGRGDQGHSSRLDGGERRPARVGLPSRPGRKS